MKKIALIAVLALAVSGCTTVNGKRQLDRQRICETSLRVLDTVADVAVVLEQHGFERTNARRVAQAAVASGDTVSFVCAVLASAGK